MKLAECVLWDGDFYMVDDFLDLNPDANRAEKDFLGITEDYFIDVAPDPTDAELVEIVKTLRSLRSAVL